MVHIRGLHATLSHPVRHARGTTHRRRYRREPGLPPTTLSEAFVLTKDGQLVDTLTLIDPSRTIEESACQPYAGKSSDQHVGS